MLVRVLWGFDNVENFNLAIVVNVLNDWVLWRNGFVIMDEICEKLSDLLGVCVFFVMC